MTVQLGRMTQCDRIKPSPMTLLSGAVDQETFQKVIRDNLSPEAVATIIAFLQPAAFYKPANKDAMQALRQVEWFSDMLTEMLGVEKHNFSLVASAANTLPITSDTF